MRVAAVVSLLALTAVGYGAQASPPARCVAGHRCAARCAPKPASCHARHRQSAAQRACAAAGGNWTCRTEAPAACYCGEP